MNTTTTISNLLTPCALLMLACCAQQPASPPQLAGRWVSSDHICVYDGKDEARDSILMISQQGAEYRAVFEQFDCPVGDWKDKIVWEGSYIGDDQISIRHAVYKAEPMTEITGWRDSVIVIVSNDEMYTNYRNGRRYTRVKE